MKINLARQNTRKYRRAEVIRRINWVVIVVSAGLFALAVMVLTGQLVYYNMRIGQLNKDFDQLQLIYTDKAREVVEYIKIKQILSSVATIENRRFRYKDFLFELYQLLPPEARLGAVDFMKEGVMTATIRVSNSNDYQVLIDRIKKESAASDFLFKGIAQDSLTRTKDGDYLVNLEMKVR